MSEDTMHRIEVKRTTDRGSEGIREASSVYVLHKLLRTEVSSEDVVSIKQTPDGELDIRIKLNETKGSLVVNGTKAEMGSADSQNLKLDEKNPLTIVQTSEDGTQTTLEMSLKKRMEISEKEVTEFRQTMESSVYSYMEKYPKGIPKDWPVQYPPGFKRDSDKQRQPDTMDDKSTVFYSQFSEGAHLKIDFLIQGSPELKTLYEKSDSDKFGALITDFLPGWIKYERLSAFTPSYELDFEYNTATCSIDRKLVPLKPEPIEIPVVIPDASFYKNYKFRGLTEWNTKHLGISNKDSVEFGISFMEDILSKGYVDNRYRDVGDTTAIEGKEHFMSTSTSPIASAGFASFDPIGFLVFKFDSEEKLAKGEWAGEALTYVYLSKIPPSNIKVFMTSDTAREEMLKHFSGREEEVEKAFGQPLEMLLVAGWSYGEEKELRDENLDRIRRKKYDMEPEYGGKVASSILRTVNSEFESGILH